jgi:SEC-C motif domain protein
MDTTHPEHPQHKEDRVVWKAEIEQFCRETRFLFLKILESTSDGDTASVTFTAHLHQHNQDADFTEKSIFLRENGRWLYQAGDLQVEAL